ncbi:Testis-expressed sequence 2 protein, partial [Dryobates pubescens]
QGWMNQLHTYDPELFHPSLTHSVLATLDGATLKLSYPKSNVPRQATRDEEPLETTFVSHRCYDLTDAKVSLAAPGSLYLFGRTGREKEEWYQHLVRASRGAPSSSHGDARTALPSCHPDPLVSPGTGPALQSSGSSTGGSTEDIPSAVPPKDLAGSIQQEVFLDYSTYMARFVPARAGSSPDQSPSHRALGSPTPTKHSWGPLAPVPPQGSEDRLGHSQACVAWMNALAGRICWDFLREPYWAQQVASKIQKKLSKIKLPYFMNELALTELDMGTAIPSVLSASSPTMDDRGLWVDMEVTYSGSLQMTLETKMNLCKLGKEGAAEESSPADAGREGARPRLQLLADSDAESSSAGSSDEEEVSAAEPMGALGERVPAPGTEGHGSGNSTSRRILRLVDKIAKSKYFQKATENEFIKKKIEEVSNTPLLLTVREAFCLLPSAPRYSFRGPPRLELRVRPKLGEREVTFLHVTEWIERRLQHEFQKILVMPNMDDLIIPIMSSSLDP